ncbi:MAG TPA: acyl-CoA thioesterase II [Longimicrobiaceae bacterium]|nr:acyl-CoA thioesterase II [Longimicrobiaceae bacterium]
MSREAGGFTIRDLRALLDLEPIERNIYRGRSRDILGSGRVFGGQVLAQALVAAQRTVEEGRACHSLHGYFILPGDAGLPIVYFVDRLRDGKSFTTRQVTAIQKGAAIFSMSASFQISEAGPTHQVEMPEVAGPEGLPSELDLIRQEADQIPERLRGLYTQDRPIEFRPVDPTDPFHPEPRPPRRYTWFRAIGDVGDDPLEQQAVLAYTSDYGLLGTALLPHCLTFENPHLQAATLDHALWFHHAFRVDEWLLYVTDSPSASGARGFTRGSVFTRDGVLVASVAQEGLIRVRG